MPRITKTPGIRKKVLKGSGEAWELRIICIPNVAVIFVICWIYVAFGGIQTGLQFLDL